jgi:hypothetical protein
MLVASFGSERYLGSELREFLTCPHDYKDQNQGDQRNPELGNAVSVDINLTFAGHGVESEHHIKANA